MKVTAVAPRVAARPFLRPVFLVGIELPYRQLCGVPRGPLLHQRPAKALGIYLVGYLLRICYWL
jgi:hypothetical protein